VQEGLGPALGVGHQIEEEHCFHGAGRFRAVRVPLAQVGHGRGVARGHLPHWQHNLGARTHQRHPEVGVIQKLQLARLGRDVRDDVGDLHAGPAHLGGERRNHAQLVAEQPGLVHHAGHGDLARVGVDGYFHLMGGDVGDLAVQAVTQRAVGVEFRGPVALQPAADQHLVEAVQPADSPGLVKVDEGRVHGPQDGRLPAQPDRALHGVPDAHAARGHAYEAERPVVDLDHVHPLAQPSPQRAIGHAVAPGSPPHLRRPHRDPLHVDVLFHVTEHESLLGHGNTSPPSGVVLPQGWLWDQCKGRARA